MQHSFGLDDVFCLLAEAACLPTTIMQSVTPGLGFGRDTWGCTADNIYTVLKVLIVSSYPSGNFHTNKDIVGIRIASFILPLLRLHEALLPVFLHENLPQQKRPQDHIRFRLYVYSI